MGILSGLMSQQLLSATASSPRIQTLRARTPPPTMCLQQQQQHQNNKLLVSHKHKESVASLAFSIFSDDNNRISMNTFSGFDGPVANCHELLLTPTFDRNRDLTLLNPSTKEVIKTLPKSPRPPTSLVYHEWLSFCGLGLDHPKTSDYKVIRFLEFEYEDKAKSRHMDHYLAELYSLKTDSWKQIAYPHADDAYPIPYQCVPIYINGFGYWTASSGYCNEDLVIISFDFANESFPSALIPGPSAYKLSQHERNHFLLVEFEGSLALVVYSVQDKLFQLWVWNSDDESWSRRGEWAVGVDVFCLQGLLRNDQFYFQDSMGELMLFDCAKQQLKNLGVNSEHSRMVVFPYP